MNYSGLILLSPVVIKETKSYFARLSASETDDLSSVPLADTSFDDE